eukprot:SAG31_NODE_24315_length_484_cov_1.057143_2_plen_48_part_01
MEQQGDQILFSIDHVSRCPCVDGAQASLPGHAESGSHTGSLLLKYIDD